LTPFLSQLLVRIQRRSPSVVWGLGAGPACGRCEAFTFPKNLDSGKGARIEEFSHSELASMSESTDVQVRCKEGVRDTSKPLYTNGTRAACAVLLGQAGVGPPTPSSRSLSLSLSPDSLSQCSLLILLRVTTL
jgi:hypothetical protein